MKRSIFETLLGASVIGIAVFFLMFSYKTGDAGRVSGYTLTADFTGLGGLGIGDDVQISGVKVGSISRLEIDPETYLARVHMSIDPAYQVPLDTAALISSISLMGGKYLSLEPGAEEDMIEAGGHIYHTQAPQNLEQLLGKFIFSMKTDNDDS